MNAINERLLELEGKGTPVVIGLIGAGQMGQEILCQAQLMKGVRIPIVVDVTFERAALAYGLAAVGPNRIVSTNELDQARQAIEAGKGKNNPLDIYARPDQLEAQAKARDMNARMLCEFVDGSKTAVEMCSVSNCTGLVPDIRGLHGAQATRATLHQVFCPKEQGGVLQRKGVVDFAIGVHPGVFVVFTTNQPRLKQGLIQRDMGHGPNYLLFRPYHLCSIEVPLTAAQAVIYHESSGHPLSPPTSECLAITKQDLKAAAQLDGIGEYCYRGSIDLASGARRENLLPLGLAKGCTLKRAVPKDHAIRYDDIAEVPDTLLLQMRKLQDRLCV